MVASMSNSLFKSAPCKITHVIPGSSGKQIRSRVQPFTQCQLQNSQRAAALPSKSQNIAAGKITDDGMSLSAPANLLERLIATTNKFDVQILSLAAALGVVLVLGHADAAEASVQTHDHLTNTIGDLAENEDFWSNVLRYISYFFSVLLGTAYVAIRPLVELLKKPQTAVLAIAGVALVYFLVSTTVSAMLGINDLVEYEPSSIVTPMS